MITLKLTRDTISPDVRRLLREAESNGPLARVLGRAAANTLRRHFRDRNKTPNALGGTRTNFWSRIAESVQAPRTTTGKIVVPVSHPAIAQKVFGGTITPKKSKYLAIPIDPRAHGKSPRVMPLLRFAMTRSGVKLLGLRENGRFQALYVLKSSVSQGPDPKSLPENDVMGAALEKAGEIHLGRRA